MPLHGTGTLVYVQESAGVLGDKEGYLELFKFSPANATPWKKNTYNLVLIGEDQLSRATKASQMVESRCQSRRYHHTLQL